MDFRIGAGLRGTSGNTSPVHSGNESISVTASAWQALSFWHQDFSATAFSNLTFWYMVETLGDKDSVYTSQYGTNTGPTVQLPVLPANSWQLVQVSLTKLGVANVNDLNRIYLQLTSSGSSATFYVDDIQLTPKSAPLIHVAVEAGQSIRAADARWFGVNTAVWDSHFDTPTTVSALSEMGTRVMRFPGWFSLRRISLGFQQVGNNSWQWVTSLPISSCGRANVGAEVFITVNYGTGQRRKLPPGFVMPM